jgi:predicted nuclease of predicted toxin-antitoxin system
VRFLLDEHISPLVTARLRALGRDAVAVTERDGLRGSSDGRILEAAVAEDRVLVTSDLRDFGSLGARMAAIGEPHPGIILVSSRRFPPSADTVGRVSEALNALAISSQAAGLRDRVVWLAEVDDAP